MHAVASILQFAKMFLNASHVFLGVALLLAAQKGAGGKKLARTPQSARLTRWVLALSLVHPACKSGVTQSQTRGCQVAESGLLQRQTRDVIGQWPQREGKSSPIR